MNKSLFERLYNTHNLINAWKEIKQKGSSGGVDGVSISLFDEHISENIRKLQTELKDHKWQPQPYLSISIPKTKNKNEKRELGLLSIKDKIVQQAIKQLLEYRFENEFVPNSFAYRHEKGHNKAVRFFKFCCQNNKFKYALRLDIDNYFDNINHDILLKRIHHLIADDELFRLVQLCIKMGTVTRNMEWKDVVKGGPQGAVLSPMLANYYLSSFDQFVLTKTNLYVRYADDFIIGCETLEEANVMLSECKAFLNERLKLGLNNPTITDINEGVEFLGVIINKCVITISDDKKERLKNRIRALSWINNGFDTKGIKSIKAISTYYSKIIPQDILEELDMVIIDQLKNIIEKYHENIKSKKHLSLCLKDFPFLSEKNILDKSVLVSNLEDYFYSINGKNSTKSSADENKNIIQKRKREYRQKENEMSEMVISSYGTYIGVNNGKLSIKIKGKFSGRRVSSNLHHITIVGDGVSMSGKAISYCMSKNIGVDYFSYNGKHQGSILSSKLIDTLLWAKQTVLPLERRSFLAVNIIIGKIKNQLNLIKYFHKYHKEKYEYLKPLYSTNVRKIKNIIADINLLTGDENYVVKLICLEAQAADLYWQYVKELIKDDVIFEKREHKGAVDLVNCLLNYGYAILYARVWQMVLANKMNPYESVVHVKQTGKPTFVYDVIELFRAQAVDRVVISLIQKKEDVKIDNGILSEETRKLLVKNIVERLNRYEIYRGKESRFCDIMNSQIAEIARYIDINEKFKPYIAKW